jgi:hypothetical protein
LDSRLGGSWCFDAQEEAFLQARALMSDLSRKLAELGGLPVSIAQRLAWHFEWDFDTILEDYLRAPSTTLDNALLPPRKEPVIRMVADPTGGEGEIPDEYLCGLCYTNFADVRVSRCKHRACRECMLRQAKADIEDGKLPHKCCFFIPQENRRCDSAICSGALESLGFGNGELLLWPLPPYVDGLMRALGIGRLGQ